MKDAEVHETNQLLPLEKYLLRNKFKANSGITGSELLANIPVLPLDFKMELEQIGVFDLDEFNNIQPQYLRGLNITVSDLTRYQELVGNYMSQRKSKITLVMDLPKNYAVINIQSNEKVQSVSLHWNGILITLHSPTEIGWLTLKEKFEHYHKKQGFPTLIGVTDITSTIPDWLNNVTEISTFLSGYNPTLSLNDQAMKMGFPPNFRQNSVVDLSNKMVLQMQFILNFARNSEITPKIIA